MSKIPSALKEQLLRECDAMARYAFASGFAVPPAAVTKLQQQLNSMSFRQIPGNGTTDAAESPEAVAMSAQDIRDIVEVHHLLATLVAPATPRTIVLLDDESAKRRHLSFLGSVPLVRQMMLAAILSLVFVVTISLSPAVNTDTSESDPLIGSGMPLLLNALFYIAAAALGASFSALFTVNRYVVLGTYDPKYKSSYWIRFLLGIIAGVILADFIPIEGKSLTGVTKPLLAILGGFSATVVYRVLSRLIESVEAVFRGDPHERIAAAETSVKAHFETRSAQENVQVAKQLMSLQQSLNATSDVGEARKQLNQIVEDLVPSELGSHTDSQAPTQERSSTTK